MDLSRIELESYILFSIIITYTHRFYKSILLWGGLDVNLPPAYLVISPIDTEYSNGFKKSSKKITVRELCSLASLLPGAYAAIATAARGVIVTTLAFICFECLSILVRVNNLLSNAIKTSQAQ